MKKYTYHGRFVAFCHEVEKAFGNHRWLPQGNWYTVQCTVYGNGGACYKGATIWASSPRDAAVSVAGHLGKVYADEDGWAYDGPADDDFVVIPARSAKKVYAELTLDTDKVAGLRWPAEGMVVLDADTIEYTGKNGKTYHRLIDWEVAGVRGRSAKVLRVDDLMVVNDNDAE